MVAAESRRAGEPRPPPAEEGHSPPGLAFGRAAGGFGGWAGFAGAAGAAPGAAPGGVPSPPPSAGLASFNFSKNSFGSTSRTVSPSRTISTLTLPSSSLLVGAAAGPGRPPFGNWGAALAQTATPKRRKPPAVTSSATARDEPVCRFTSHNPPKHTASAKDAPTAAVRIGLAATPSSVSASAAPKPRGWAVAARGTTSRGSWASGSISTDSFILLPGRGCGTARSARDDPAAAARSSAARPKKRLKRIVGALGG